MNQQDPLSLSPKLTQGEVEAVVYCAIPSLKAKVISWQVNKLSGGREVISSVYQVNVQLQGTTNQQLTTLPLILKVVSATVERLAPTHWNYWLREADAYGSHYLTQLPASFAAPQCYGIDRHENEVRIWLEHLGTSSENAWAEKEIGTVCYEMGRFNGTYLSESKLPTGDWVSQDWLRQYVTTYAIYIEQLPDHQQHPLVGHSVASHLLSDLLHFVEEREDWLRQLESLPQVFCHQDIHRGNLFFTNTLTSRLQLVAIDWSFTGIAALGQELASILFTNRRLPTNVFALATEQYINGLRSVGWQGDERLVLWSSASATALNYGMAMVGQFIEQLLDPQKHAQLVDGFNSSIEDLPPRINRWVEFGLNYANLARHVMDTK